jgi:hypothetical protein
LHWQTSWSEKGRVALHESGAATSQTCACARAAAYAVWIALQSAAPAGDAHTQVARPLATIAPTSSLIT